MPSDGGVKSEPQMDCNTNGNRLKRVLYEALTV